MSVQRKKQLNAKYHEQNLDHPYDRLPFGWLYPPAFTEDAVKDHLRRVLKQDANNFAVVRDPLTQYVAAFRICIQAPNMRLEYQGPLNAQQAWQHPGFCVTYLDYHPSEMLPTTIYIGADFLRPAVV
jgi:hypothetical protein